MTEREGLLVRLLAATDAVFVPLRDYEGAANSNLYVAREEYRKHGVPWNSGGTGEAEWKKAQRTLAGLTAEGLVSLHRPHVKSIRARLTDEGEDRARALCGLPPVHAGWGTLLEVHRLTNEPPELMTDAWIDERRLMGEVTPDFGEGRWLILVEEMALPALNRGWLEAKATTRRRVYYRLTQEGCEAMAADKEPPERPERPADEEARTLYYATWHEARNRLTLGSAVRPSEIGPIPLPAAMGRLPLMAF